MMSCYKPLHSWQSIHKGCCHCWARQASSDKHKGSYSSLDKRGPLMEAMPNPVISCEDNPCPLAYCTQPLFIPGVLGKMIVMQLHCCSCLPEGIGHNGLPETTIKEKDERVYAAWRLSSHRIASSISHTGRS
jgi:hypothetical protein